MPTGSRALLANLTPRGRLILGGSALALVALIFFGMQIAGRPSYTLVDSGLDPAQTAKVTAALDDKGIAYELRNNGTALAVEKSQTAQARIALATAGLDGGSASQPGFELFDKQKIGTSDFQQKVTYQRALEGQIATTIEGVQGVTGAQVRLVLADDQLFSESSTPATAAVLLSGSSSGLDPGAVRGIAQLVSSSVKGLKSSTVSITKDELKYGASTPLKQVTETEKLAGGGGSAGAAGTAANIPSYAQSAAGGSGSNYDRKSTTKDFGVDKTVTRTKVAPGAVNRLDVALVVDKTVPAADLAALRKAVAGAAGILPSRGDTLAVSQVAFAKQPASGTPAAGPAGGMIGYAKYAAAGLGLLGFLFFSTRQLRRREGEALMREPNWLREIEAPTTLAQLEQPRVSTLPERTDDPARLQVEELAEREPERVAQQIRTWMRDS
jgi:flagellar M-ring protein FliF